MDNRCIIENMWIVICKNNINYNSYKNETKYLMKYKNQ